MAEEMNEQQLQEKLSSRFKELPKVVQNAILSADVEAHMRELADHHKLHFDQWTGLENEVMFALLGFQPVEELASNIEKEVDVSHETAVALADDISHIVFAPIRKALEEELPLAGNAQIESTTAPAQSAPGGTPAPAPPEEKSIRESLSGSYSAGGASHERKSVEGDPYREPAA